MSARKLSKGLVVATSCALMLAACGGGGGGGTSNTPAVMYSIGGTATGLTGTVILQNNAGDNLSVAASGAFTFPTRIASGRPYAVTVLTPPAGQNCTVTAGAGTVTAAVTNVAVACVAPLSVVSSAPAANAVNVSNILPLTVTYSAPLNATGLASTVTLANAGRAATFSVAAAAAVLQVTPTTPLALFAPHTLTVSTAIRGTGNEAPTAAFSVNFTTRDGQWRTSTPMQSILTQNGEDPEMSFSANGDALAVWDQDDGTRTNIWARSYHNTWGTPTLIETTNLGNALIPNVALDSAGNGIAVWEQQNGTRYDIWANHFTAGAGWDAAQLIEAVDTGDATNPQVAIDSAGNAIAVWQQSDGTHDRIRTNRYVRGTGWGTATTIDTPSNGNAGNPTIAIDANNNAIVVWNQITDGLFDVWAARYTPAGGWAAAALIETDNASDSTGPTIAFDSNGNAFAVWDHVDAAGDHAWGNRFTPAGGWGTAMRIQPPGAAQTFEPRVSCDGLGNTFVVWNQEGAANLDVWADRYVAGTGWAAPVLLDALDEDSESMQVAADLNGNAIAVWVQNHGGQYGMRARRYQNGVGWGAAASIDDPAAGGSFGSSIAVDPKGQAFAIWEQGDTVVTIQSARFD